jgi:hypothetical protein
MLKTYPWYTLLWGLSLGMCYAFEYDGNAKGGLVAIGLGCLILIPLGFVLDIWQYMKWSENERKKEATTSKNQRTSL